MSKTTFPMTPFDMLVIPETFHMIKLLLPYLPYDTRKLLAVWIKYTEFQNTISYFHHDSRSERNHPFSAKQVTATEFFEELRPYMKEEDAEQIDMALSAMNMMEMMQSEENGTNASDLFRSMMPSDTEGMFDFYSQMFEKGGDNEYAFKEQSMGRMDEQSGVSESGSCEDGTDQDSI